jgi:hypothetical protein
MADHHALTVERLAVVTVVAVHTEVTGGGDADRRTSCLGTNATSVEAPKNSRRICKAERIMVMAKRGRLRRHSSPWNGDDGLKERVTSAPSTHQSTSS